MARTYIERPSKAVERVVQAVTCDGCGGPAVRPTILGPVPAAVFEAQRHDPSGENPVMLADLCNECADAVAGFIDGLASERGGPGVNRTTDLRAIREADHGARARAATERPDDEAREENEATR